MSIIKIDLVRKIFGCYFNHSKRSLINKKGYCFHAKHFVGCLWNHAQDYLKTS